MTHCDAEGVTIGGENIAVAIVIWAAGVAASPVGQWLDEETDKAGRVIVRSDLSIKKDSRIFVVADAAAVMNEKGEPVPGIAPAAGTTTVHSEAGPKAGLSLSKGYYLVFSPDNPSAEIIRVWAKEAPGIDRHVPR
ncbi:MAG: hypothetical protein IIB76_11600 [Proteobacteria bacterium]|nr:hypothetical protein [Pseudomonadota bacterium]